MLAALFIQGGINALKAPEGHAQAAKPVLDAVADKVMEVAPIERRPDDELLVKIDGGVKVVAGSLLALGKCPRLASAALAASLIPTTLAGHRFWEETDEQRRGEQKIHFFKNVGLLGGLLIAAADTEGKPSLGWRGRKAAKLAAAAAAAQTAAVTGAA
ncbi:DoxX family protein, partial [Pseudonocardia nigra]|uniref:DoxX family protein n=1 Tax=Pseudonocardia nigra TaxID=1921578 RepID=UPI001FE8EAC9